ncbi:hypothetical protein [Cereibacter sphaeroides]|nr:hypothetical protein [Cereibacter sphaeroides]
MTLLALAFIALSGAASFTALTAIFAGGNSPAVEAERAAVHRKFMAVTS